MAFNTYQTSGGFTAPNGLATPKDVPADYKAKYKSIADGKYRFFISRAEVLAYFDTSAKRSEGVLHLVKEGATLVNDFTTSGGVLTAYWFKDGIADVNLVLVFSATVDLTNYYTKIQVNSIVSNLLPRYFTTLSDGTANDARRSISVPFDIPDDALPQDFTIQPNRNIVFLKDGTDYTIDGANDKIILASVDDNADGVNTFIIVYQRVDRSTISADVNSYVDNGYVDNYVI